MGGNGTPLSIVTMVSLSAPGSWTTPCRVGSLGAAGEDSLWIGLSLKRSEHLLLVPPVHHNEAEERVPNSMRRGDEPSESDSPGV